MTNFQRLKVPTLRSGSRLQKQWKNVGKKEILAIYKPKGWPSFRVVSFLRKQLDIKKIGFLGTLDPAAEGLLVVGISTGTKKLKDLPHNKEYVAEIAFGIKSDTWDLETQNLEFSEPPQIKKSEIAKLLKEFIGQIKQPIPMFSAKQINGQRLYKLARAGKILKKLPTKIVQINNIRLLRTGTQEIRKHILPTIKIRVACGPGTFIRSIAYVLGQKLKTDATLISLIRTREGGFSLKDAIKIK